MTLQTGINIMFLVILICHIIKLRYLHEQYMQMWHNIDFLSKNMIELHSAVKKTSENLAETIEQLTLINKAINGDE